MTEITVDMAQANEIVKNQVIVAMDLPTLEEGLELVDALHGRIRYFKIGHRLFTRYGPQVVEACADRGVEIFLDLKFYDIPTVIGDACEQLAGFENVFMTTVHASGGPEMLRAAVDGVRRGRPKNPPKVVAVTALTSFSADEMPRIGVGMNVAHWASRLADLAVECGADGLVASAREAEALRRAHGKGPLLVTPGIRLEENQVTDDDQQRVDTPGRALKKGASMLVMGRPIYQSDDPAAMVDLVAESVASEGPF